MSQLPLPRTFAELRERLAPLGIDADHVQSMQLAVAIHDDALLIKVTSFALDPLGQRFMLLDGHGEGEVATEERLLPLAALLGSPPSPTPLTVAGL